LTEPTSLTVELVDKVAGAPVARIIGACDDMNWTKAWRAATVCACCWARVLGTAAGAVPANIAAANAVTTAMEATNDLFIRCSSLGS
jgi:hypothetical protein